MVSARGFQDFLYQFGVRAIGDTHLDPQSAVRVVQHPVGDLPGNQFRIGYEDILVIQRFDFGGANAYAFDEAFDCAHGDKIANFHRSFKQQNHARNKIVDYRLKAKTDTDGQCGGNPGQAGETYADQRKAGNARNGESRIPGQGYHRIPGATIHGHVAHPASLYQALDPTGYQ